MTHETYVLFLNSTDTFEGSVCKKPLVGTGNVADEVLMGEGGGEVI